MNQAKRILVAPLNWGLGHATRCIPMIRELQRQHAEVILASDGRALDLLKTEFPDLVARELPGYNITYHSDNMVRNIAWQLPKISRAVWKEYHFTQKLIARYRLDRIISDNPYGCYSSKIPCVFLTHQLNIKTPYPATNGMINFFNHLFIRQFDACWVPDVAGEPNLSGELSHGVFEKKIHFTGALSRMFFFETVKKYDVIAVLSGPEPQRTFLEQLIIDQAGKLPQRFLIVQGKTERKERFFIAENVEVVSFLTSEELNEAILASKIFIGRSGYSTIMDLAKLQKQAIFIPTPGQMEQEYLAGKMTGEHLFLVQEQRALDLNKAIQEVNRYSGFTSDFFNEKALADAVRNLLGSCSAFSTR